MVTKFSHHTDPRNPKRTLTLARTFETVDNKRFIRVGYSINFVPVAGNRDVYDRKQGNLVAAGRMVQAPFVLAIEEGQDPVTVITDFFKNAPSSSFKKKSIPMTRIKSILGL